MVMVYINIGSKFSLESCNGHIHLDALIAVEDSDSDPSPFPHPWKSYILSINHL